jgi:DNA polymerase epsilon subunit 1
VAADIRAGHWYNVRVKDGVTTVTHRPDLLQRAEPVICAFDIETTKLPLRFPNAAYDQVRGLHPALNRLHLHISHWLTLQVLDAA